MCGIAGVFDNQGGIDRQAIRARLRAMNAAQTHRGPDDEAVSVFDRGGLGHTRLAIIDPANGRQPMCGESASTWIAFNGEIYNHAGLRSLIPGDRFKTNTDSETVVRLYETLGPTFVERLEGMFAIAILDDAGLFLARDPLGIKPLYYGSDDAGVIHFASEIRTLAPYVGKIIEFPSGHWYHSKRGFHRYFDLEALACDAVSEAPMSELAAVNRIQESLAAAVEKRLMADVPLGVFLSGGLDSSIVSAIAVRKAGRLHSFAVGTKDGGDLPAAQVAAKHLGTEHHERVIEEIDVVRALPKVVSSLESYDRALVRSAVANYFLAELTAEYVKVALAGEGADELFAGYEYMRSLPPNDVHRESVEITGNLHNSNLQRCDRMTMAHGLEARVPFLDIDVLKVAFAIPQEFKINCDSNRTHEKWILRRAFAALLPDEITWRPKQKFSQGSGMADTLERYAEVVVSDADYRQAVTDRLPIDSKEELLYYRLYKERISNESALSTIGRTRSPELN